MQAPRISSDSSSLGFGMKATCQCVRGSASLIEVADEAAKAAEWVHEAGIAENSASASAESFAASV